MAPEEVSIVDRRDPGHTSEADSVLIGRLQREDITALGALFERYKALVYRTALAIVRDERAAEDVLQECFVRLYMYANSVDPERPLRPWLYRVTVNLSYDWSSQRVLHPLDDMLEWLSGIAGAFPAPDHKAEERETIRMVREVVAALPPPHRAVIVLFYMEALSVDEISQILDLPVGTVKSRLHYARERLRDMVERRQRPVPEMTYEFT